MNKLARDQVLAIRRQFNAGHTTREIAQAYGRSERAIRDVVAGRSYGRVVDDPDCPHLPSPQRPPRPRSRVIAPKVAQ